MAAAVDLKGGAKNLGESIFFQERGSGRRMYGVATQVQRIMV